VVTVLLRLMEVAVPEQITCEGGVAVRSGSGLTVMSTFSAGPGHPAAVAMMVYLTTAGEFVGLTNDWTMVVPVPFAKPVAVPLNKVAV
jgi:hypothetical protein